MSCLEIIRLINAIIAAIFLLCCSYQFCYVAAPFIRKKKTCGSAKLHRYAVLIAARNEQAVITQLIESIRNQTYPSHLVKIFVVADNCTDDTAAKARAAGAIVWERFDNQRVGKGYALDFLYDKICKMYPRNAFDGFFVFDADNLLDENYIAEMNKMFSSGKKIITSYRNSKNYGRNWVSAGLSLWFLWESQFLNRARNLLGTSCAVSGTGFLFHRSIIEKTGGWKFFLLTEDIEFNVHHVIDGEKIAYCESAIFYDEQPVKFSQSWSQRMRWSRGYIEVLRKYGLKLLKSTITKSSFSCFDMAMNTVPAIVLSVLSLLVNVIGAVLILISGGDISGMLSLVGKAILNMYIMFFLIGCITTVSEWKRIYCCPSKKILYMFTFPLFMFTTFPISVIALFRNVEWKQIYHLEAKTLNDVRNIA